VERLADELDAISSQQALIDQFKRQKRALAEAAVAMGARNARRISGSGCSGCATGCAMPACPPPPWPTASVR